MTFFADLEDGRMKVISRRDRAIEGVDEKTYGEYLKTLDETILGVTDESKVTRFVMRKILPYKSALKVKNAQITMDQGTVTPQLSFMSEEVRLSLIDVENPEVPASHKKFLLDFKRESDGGAAFKLMSILESAGVINDLYTARQHTLANNKVGDLDKKKSLPSSS